MALGGGSLIHRKERASPISTVDYIFSQTGLGQWLSLIGKPSGNTGLVLDFDALSVQTDKYTLSVQSELKLPSWQ